MEFVVGAIVIGALALVLSGRLGRARKSDTNTPPADDPRGDGPD